MRDRPALIAVSHGTADPAGQERITALARAVRTRTPAEVLLTHVDVQSPPVGEVVAALPPGRAAVVVPVLLSAGYHVKVDLREAAGGLPVAGALGPDERLVEVLARRALGSGFVRGHHRVVLAAAGSTDAGAVADCRAVAARVAARLGTEVTDAYLSAARPGVATAVGTACRQDPARPVLVLSYLLAPGYFQSRLVAEAAAAGAAATTAPLLGESGPVPVELADLVVSRYRATVEGCSIPGRTARGPTASRC
ncbi:MULTISPECIES: sirohydrochlorin chelatase [Micrococcaceae]|uniref:sirohydrochlorin chelatase n=1 Tax=Micrococcaceae TaxID=1268 RepID=UPI00161022F7|nr:CbiX/SirB N-terminal domain-containing protein [Citricoccus sp.]MBB5749708.1 sirohydrochlorin ferrochelatase [Micrococcus sp. TA1]HRO29960.1 CbiX/SirB N-terminal domain-containing protein [Citricoccus sp.]HRO93272.1 CbiX/SirB N-terminal domain-containing protein [Citricoccus sp.]